MALAVAREAALGSRSIAMPLTAPSVQAAAEFLEWLVPPSVFSAGAGRRRRRSENLVPVGQRSDQGFLVFYRRAHGAEAPRMVPLKSPSSISRYLENQLATDAADHWVCTQITQYRACRDGKPAEAFRADGARHVLSLVADLDGHRMDPMYQRLLQEDWLAFQAALEAYLDGLGLDSYLIVRSGPEGVHVHLPLIRDDGRPLRASIKTLADWERAAKGVCRYLTPFGADANAVRAVQPFVIPGMPRAKYPGFIPHVVVRRDGARTNLYALTRRLAALQMLVRTKPSRVLPTGPVPGQDVAALLEEIRTKAAGVGQGERNQAAHDLAVYLLCKGARPAETWAVLQSWNDRNSPPLPERELRRCLASAERCESDNPQQWAQMRLAAWFRLRSLLGLPAVNGAGYRLEGRWRPLTPRKSWEDRKTRGGREHYAEVAERVLRFVAGEGGSVELTQSEIADVIDTNRSTLRAVLRLLDTAGKLVVTAKRGRGGRSVLSLPVKQGPIVDRFTENGQSRNSSVVAQLGAWVGLGFDGGVSGGLGVSAGRLPVLASPRQWHVVLRAGDWPVWELLWSPEVTGLGALVVRRLGCRVGVCPGVDPGPDPDLDG